MRWDALGICQVTALTTESAPLGGGRIEGSALLPDAMAGAALREMIGEVAAPGLVPLGGGTQ
ncbi:hypothetical protein AB0M95_18590 [Sphaerisporangium sp. NPDC051017]|uniref:hypothetical protein n=1 Tax=Sphaerisporangium sp. NPDC051017 TaxID=3154636 RepID=UPI003417A5BF